MKLIPRSTSAKLGSGVAVLSLLATVPAAASFGPGGAGIGDPYYPTYGNSGYDVSHYGLKVAYAPTTDTVSGTATITATATSDLSRFNLDLVLHASSVTVNGRRAGISQSNPHELVVTPSKKLKRGASMTIVVQYAGVPSSKTVDGINPWIRTSDGAAAVGEPEIAAWWYPSNDHPRDKATFDIALTVPKGLAALSNGVLKSRKVDKGTEIWTWRESKPMATYLAFMTVGKFDVTSGTTKAGLPWLNAVASEGGSEGTYAAADLARTEEVVDWHSKQWGPYPFDAIGGVAPKADFGFALENQTRPVYTRGFWRNGSNIYVVVHEQAHQWYGDSVSVNTWRNIWLNEGFASFAEWYWSEQHGEGSAQSLLASYYNDPSASYLWNMKIGDPGKGKEFDGAVYDRGAMTLQALRNRIGSPAFFDTMRSWARQRAGGTGTIEQFIALAEKRSGQNLTSFFTAWLFTAAKPAATQANGLSNIASSNNARSTDSRPASRSAIDFGHAQMVDAERAPTR